MPSVPPLRRSDCEASKAMAPKRLTETARAATSGHTPASVVVRASATKKSPIATPDRSARVNADAPEPARWLVQYRFRMVRLRDQRDRNDGEHDAADGDNAGPLSQSNCDEYRDDDRAYSGCRRDDSHHTNRERPVEQRDPRATSEARDSTPDEVHFVGRSGREERKGNQQQEEPGELRHDDNRERTRPFGREATEEVSSTVTGCRRERQEGEH